MLQELGMKAGEGVIGQALGMVFGGAQDRRQLKQQEKLQKLQIAGSKEMADYNNAKAMEMWNNTNYGAQVAHAKEAGLNPGMLYGMSGGGGTTAGSGSSPMPTGGTADGGVARTGLGMQMTAQTALLQAQKENIEADTENKKAEATKTGEVTKGLGFENYVKEQTQQEAIEKIIAETSRATDEAGKAGLDTDHAMKTFEARVRQTQEEALGKILANEGVKTENRQKVAELAVKQFEAEMAKNGIANNTPWYVKFLTELANKFNLNPLK